MADSYWQEISVALLFLATGFAIKTQLTCFGIYAPAEYLFINPFCPPWLLAMWLNLSTIFTVALRWLIRR